MKINPSKTIQKFRTEDELRHAVYALCDGKAQRTIPPQVDDSDIVLLDAIAELLELRQQVEDVRGWMHAWLAKATRR